MRVRSITAILLALACSGCATGRINSGYPWPVEAAAPASSGKSLLGDIPGRGSGPIPLRQMQVDLNVVLTGALERGGVRVINYPNTQASLDGAKSVDISGLDDRRALDKLVGAVGATSHPDVIRNEIAAHLIAASNANCNVYLQALRGGQVDSRLLSDLFAATFGAVGGIAKSAQTAKRMASYAGLSVAIGASVDRNIFAEQGAELVADQIVILRGRDRVEIEKRMDDPYAKWPMGLALADTMNYHGDCSMIRGFAYMRKELEAREAEVKAIRVAAVTAAAKGASGEIVASIVSAQAADAVAAASRPKPKPAIGREDIDADYQAGLDCIKAAEDEFKAKPALLAIADAADGKTLGRTGACKPGDAWRGRYANQAFDALKAHLDTAAISKAQGVLAGAPTEDAKTAALKDLSAAFGKVRTVYDTTASTQTAAEASQRTRLYDSLGLIGDKGDPDKVLPSVGIVAAPAKPADPVVIEPLSQIRATAGIDGLAPLVRSRAARTAMEAAYETAVSASAGGAS